jgi:hypothetical protein
MFYGRRFWVAIAAAVVLFSIGMGVGRDRGPLSDGAATVPVLP